MYRIMIADDEPLIIKGLRKMMDWERMDVRIIGEAQDGRELMELLEKEQPDIIISDISMPGKSGLDIIREISEQNMDTKVIFVSGFQEFSYAKAAIKYGAVDYLLKPVTVEELEKAINRAKEMLGERRQNETAVLSSETEDGKEGGVSDETAMSQGKQTGIRFELSGAAAAKVKNPSQFELMRFAAFRQIEELLQERGFQFWVKRDENGSSVVLELEEGVNQEQLNDMVETIQSSIRSKFGLTVTAGIGAVPQQQFLEGVEQITAQKARPENEAIVKVKTYIQEHFAEDLTLEQVAQIVYMNPYYFSTFFKRETGQNFKNYLLEVRMKKAQQYLMETDMKTYELACSVGYHDVRTFTEKFREFYGKSPAKYRKNNE